MTPSLELLHILPETLPESALEFTQVWNQKIQIGKGEHVLITAPSGKGKSTLVSILYGLRKDYTGRYFVAGTDTRTFSQARWSDFRSGEAGVVFQDLRLFPDLSALENLEIKGRLQPGHFRPEEVKPMAAVLGVDHLLDRPCGLLSFGERQRIAILRCLIMKADYIFMDEPFSHLDEKNAFVAMELVRGQARKNQSTLIITSLGQDYGWNYDRLIIL